MANTSTNSTNTNAGQYQQQRTRGRPFFNIRQFIVDKKSEGLSIEEIIHELMGHVEQQITNNNRTPLYTICEHTTTYYYALIEREAGTRPFRPINPEVRRQATEAGVKTIYEKVLSTILPTGKTISDSTREEIVEFRGYLTNLISLLQPGQTPREAGITEF